MAGSLFHALRFTLVSYVGSDQHEHTEVEPVDGDVDMVSHTSWRDLVEYCARLHVPEEAWPSFPYCELGIDVPMNEIQAKQPVLREALARLTPAEVAGHPLLARVMGYLNRGELVFFTN